MRGQFRVTLSGFTIGTTEATVLGIIVPADTAADINRIEIIGGATVATRVRWRLRRFTTGTPTLVGPITPQPVDGGNAFPPSLTFGTSWSAAPADYQGELVPGQFEAFGGRDLIVASLSETIARIGVVGAAARYDLTAIAAAAAPNCELRFTFSE